MPSEFALIVRRNASFQASPAITWPVQKLWPMCSHHTECANLSFCVWSYSEAQAVVDPEAILLLQHPHAGCQASIITLGSRVTSFTSACCPERCPLKAASQCCFCCCDEMPWESSRETRCSLAHGSALGSVSAWRHRRASDNWPHCIYPQEVVQNDRMPAC